jgi:polysaccharide biosynthesis PFTS motif protein
MKASKVPVGNFETLDDFKDHDHWHKTEEQSFKYAKEIFFQANSDKYIEYSKQIEVIQIEQYYFFKALSDQQLNITRINYIEHRKYCSRDKYSFLSSINYLLDYLYLSANSIQESLREIIKAIVALKTKSHLPLKKVKIISSGISPYAIPSRAQDLSFHWPNLNNLCKKEEILYILPIKPNKAQSKFLSKDNILYLRERELISILNLKEKFSFLISFTASLIIHSLGLLSTNSIKKSVSILKIQEVKWKYFFKKINPEIYLTSLSTAWPSPPEALLKDQCGFKHIIWFYGTGEFHYSNDNSQFQDISVRFSIFNADQVWLWNKNVRDLFLKRKLYDYQTEFIITGPIIYSDLLARDSSSNKQLKIAIFDIPPIVPKERINLGIGPFTTKDIQNAFYDDILKLIKKYPEITFVFKEKRQFEEKFEIINSIQAIKDSSNTSFRNPLESPLRVLQEVNFSISTPFTSPSIYSETLGKPAVYYEPLKFAKFTADKAIDEMNVNSYDELTQKIDSLISGELSPIQSFEKITPEKTITIMKEQLKKISKQRR